jgi:hypothetical protein
VCIGSIFTHNSCWIAKAGLTLASLWLLHWKYSYSWLFFHCFYSHSFSTSHRSQNLTANLPFYILWPWSSTVEVLLLVLSFVPTLAPWLLLHAPPSVTAPMHNLPFYILWPWSSTVEVLLLVLSFVPTLAPWLLLHAPPSVTAPMHIILCSSNACTSSSQKPKSEFEYIAGVINNKIWIQHHLLPRVMKKILAPTQPISAGGCQGDHTTPIVVFHCWEKKQCMVDY